MLSSFFSTHFGLSRSSTSTAVDGSFRLPPSTMILIGSTTATGDSFGNPDSGPGVGSGGLGHGADSGLHVGHDGNTGQGRGSGQGAGAHVGHDGVGHVGVLHCGGGQDVGEAHGAVLGHGAQGVGDVEGLGH